MTMLMVMVVALVIASATMVAPSSGPVQLGADVDGPELSLGPGGFADAEARVDVRASVTGLQPAPLRPLTSPHAGPRMLVRMQCPNPCVDASHILADLAPPTRFDPATRQRGSTHAAVPLVSWASENEGVGRTHPRREWMRPSVNGLLPPVTGAAGAGRR